MYSHWFKTGRGSYILLLLSNSMQESFDLFSQLYCFYHLFFLNSLFGKTQLASHRAADLGKVLQKVTSLLSLKSFFNLSCLKTTLIIARHQIVSIHLYLCQTVGFFWLCPSWLSSFILLESSGFIRQEIPCCYFFVFSGKSWPVLSHEEIECK